MNLSKPEKYIGLVKWFHDQARDANYGFIQHAKLGDLFFHERSIEKGENINLFRENAIVIFAAQESKKHKEKLEAVDIKYLDNETDLNFLFNHFLSILSEKGKYTDYNIIQKGVHSKIISLLEYSTDINKNKQLFEQFRNYVNGQIWSKTIHDEEYLIGILKVGKNFFPSDYNQINKIIEKNIPTELAHKLWLDNYIDTCQISYVATIILSEPQHIKQKIFSKCSEDDKSNIFFKVLHSLENIDTPHKLQLIKDFLKLSEAYVPQQHEKILNSIINICPDYYKLNLWLEDYHQNLDFNSYKLYTVTLSPAIQKKFVKKVLKFIHEEKVNITIEELTSINIIDFETSKLAEKIDGSHLDYSTSIILNVISDIKNKTNLETKRDSTSAKHRIYDLIIKQIKQPKDILQITGFFDECQGRCSVSVHEEKNEEGEVTDLKVSYNRNKHNKAKNHPICDGRKALDKATKTPLLSDERVEYWWCANQKCFKPSRELHSSNEWEKYSLLDFLTILKIDFKESDLEIYLNIINKANRFLKHLNCRECNHILYPKGKTRYAFYGVSNFSCKTETCSQKGKEIYLSHCLNGYCEMEIDSRDCVKCKPAGHDADTCGWYVCNYCHSCCSSEQLQKRKWVYDNILHSDYKCHLEGHRNSGFISCNKCGHPMKSNEANVEDYERILNWFISNKDKSERIYKSGKNKKDKWWFTIRRRNDTMEEFRKKLTKYHQLGFQIPDFDNDKDLQLISEPINFKKHNSDILTCKTCGNILDLSNDIEKAKAIKQFHNVTFAKEAIE